jgi:hypothetical protein
LKVRRATLSDLLHGKAALTPEIALRIEKAFGPDMDHLLPHAARLRRGENARTRARHFDQAVRPGLKAGRRRRGGACEQQVSGLKKAPSLPVCTRRELCLFGGLLLGLHRLGEKGSRAQYVLYNI